MRRYTPLKRQSLKVRQGEPGFKAVYRLVDQRSEGRCEVWIAGSRCARRAVDHHHLVKPRRVFHHPGIVVHVCREHHDRFSWPYHRGRLRQTGWRIVDGIMLFNFTIRFASDKFAASQPQAGP